MRLLASLAAIKNLSLGINTALKKQNLSPLPLRPRNSTLKKSSDKSLLLLIEKDFAINLQAMLLLHPEITHIDLKSEGGNLQEALDTGYVIHRLNLDTLITGTCFSA